MSQSIAKPHSSRQVLVVEDEPAVCELLSDILRGEGLQPVCVQSDTQAYEALRSAPAFACMVVDVNLGVGATGYDVARFARRLDAQLPVIFVSGQTSPDSMERFGVPGALFLEKPFTGEDLLRRIHKLVGDNDD